MVLTSILVYSFAISSFDVPSFYFTLFLPILCCDSLDDLEAGGSGGRLGSGICRLEVLGVGVVWAAGSPG